MSSACVDRAPIAGRAWALVDDHPYHWLPGYGRWSRPGSGDSISLCVLTFRAGVVVPRSMPGARYHMQRHVHNTDQNHLVQIVPPMILHHITAIRVHPWHNWCRLRCSVLCDAFLLPPDFCVLFPLYFSPELGFFYLLRRTVFAGISKYWSLVTAPVVFETPIRRCWRRMLNGAFVTSGKRPPERTSHNCWGSDLVTDIATV